MRHLNRRTPALTCLVAAVLVSPLLLAPTASAAPTINSSDKLQRAVTAKGVVRHLTAFEKISNANDDNRAAGTPGYDASARYVFDKLEDAGYDVEYQEFEFPFFQELSDPEFERISPDPATFVAGEDFATMTFSAAGDVTAPVTAVDVEFPPAGEPGATDSGCEAEDFAGFPAGNIALVQRGFCPFGDKAANAEAAGADAVIIFNEGQEGRTDAFAGTLGGPVGIPAVGTSYAIGQSLASGAVARVATDTLSETRTTRNVIAQSQTGDPNNVVMAGAHLDSVIEGPGINDNGTGSAAILEVALQMAKVQSTNQVRFAWWSAEELGLLGSDNYVATLPEAERAKIALYLNFDMVGSPNFMRGVYDGDGSTFEPTAPVPPGSAQIENVFNEHFASKRLPFQGTEFSGRSDYQAFINNGIPSGGLFTGAEGLKTEAEAELYGGVAGEQYDPCYHQACDSLTPTEDGADLGLYRELRNRSGNVNRVALDTNSNAIAHSMFTFADDTAVLAGPQATGKSTVSSESGKTKGKVKVSPGREGDLNK